MSASVLGNMAEMNANANVVNKCQTAINDATVGDIIDLTAALAAKLRTIESEGGASNVRRPVNAVRRPESTLGSLAVSNATIGSSVGSVRQPQRLRSDAFNATSSVSGSTRSVSSRGSAVVAPTVSGIIREAMAAAAPGGVAARNNASSVSGSTTSSSVGPWESGGTVVSNLGGSSIRITPPGSVVSGMGATSEFSAAERAAAATTARPRSGAFRGETPNMAAAVLNADKAIALDKIKKGLGPVIQQRKTLKAARKASYAAAKAIRPPIGNNQLGGAHQKHRRAPRRQTQRRSHH